MEKELYRSVIRFFFWKGYRAAKSESAYTLCTVTLLLRWRPSKIGLMSFNIVTRRTWVFDEPRSGAPKTANTENNVNKINDLVLQTAD